MGRGTGARKARLPLVSRGPAVRWTNEELEQVEFAAREMATLGQALRAERRRTPDLARRQRLAEASKGLAQDAGQIAGHVAVGRKHQGSLGALIVARSLFLGAARTLSKLGLRTARRELEAITAARLAPIAAGTRVRAAGQVGSVTGRFRFHNCGGGCYRVEVNWDDGTRSWPPTKSLR